MANTTTITGNLTREPEIRYTREGQATAQLGRGRQPTLAGPGDPGVAGGRRRSSTSCAGGTWPRTSP